MILIFDGGKTGYCEILKETKKYIDFRCKSNNMKYRYNKETQEVQDGTYHNVLKKLRVRFN